MNARDFDQSGGNVTVLVPALITATPAVISVPPEPFDRPPPVMFSARFTTLQKRAAALDPPLRLLLRVVFDPEQAPDLSDEQSKAPWLYLPFRFVIRPADAVPRSPKFVGDFIAWTSHPSDNSIDRDFSSLDQAELALQGNPADEQASPNVLSLLFDSPWQAGLLSSAKPATAGTEQLIERDENGDVRRVVERPLPSGGSTSPAGTVVGDIRAIHERARR